jgi:hypothetical protein
MKPSGVLVGCCVQVYKGLWKGTVVAVKTIVLPAVMSGQEKREKMAIMEAAISSALSHPNIMQVCIRQHTMHVCHITCTCGQQGGFSPHHVPPLPAQNHAVQAARNMQ